VAIHPGTGPGLPNYKLGQKGAVNDLTLHVGQIPAHNLDVSPGARNGGGDETNPEGG